ncbi:MAG: dihydrodipicolinate synthase family protein [Synergistaceae bacterium]|nr:dihydrodipicolinate synthase family protein [Synergistaceae bacterium]
MKKLEGVIVPLVTPISASGDIDKVNFKKLINYVVSNGASGLMPTAGTGEGVGLSMRQRLEAVEFCVEEANGKYPVIPGVIVPGFGDCVDITLRYKKIGADAVMLLTPYFTSFGGQETLLDYFNRFAELTEIPFMIENLPSRTAVNMMPCTMQRLSDNNPYFCSVKECVNDPMQFAEVIHRIGDSVSVLCGFEAMFAWGVLSGAAGGVIATANIFPQIYVALLKAFKEKDAEKVMKIYQEQICPLNEIAYLTPNPGPIRYALEYLGIKNGSPILPVQLPNLQVQKKIRDTIDDLRKVLNA